MFPIDYLKLYPICFCSRDEKAWLVASGGLEDEKLIQS